MLALKLEALVLDDALAVNLLDAAVLELLDALRLLRPLLRNLRCGLPGHDHPPLMGVVCVNIREPPHQAGFQGCHLRPARLLGNHS